MAETPPPRAKHDKIKHVFRETAMTMSVYLAVRWGLGERLPSLSVLGKMLLCLLAVISVLELLEDDASDSVVGVARANCASAVLGMASKA